jgi:hypothetical protein
MTALGIRRSFISETQPRRDNAAAAQRLESAMSSRAVDTGLGDDLLDAPAECLLALDCRAGSRATQTTVPAMSRLT